MQHSVRPSMGWWALVWLLRLAGVAAVYGVWVNLTGSRSVEAWACAGSVFVAFILQGVARRQALGWIVDDSGERQKVLRWNRGHAIFAPTSRPERIIREAKIREERRKRLLWLTVFGAADGAAVGYVWMNNPYFVMPTLFLFWTLCLVGGILAVVWAWNCGVELLYLSGWQDMDGAKVLDAPSPRPGLAEVIEQKAHGAGRISTKEEALVLLNPESSPPAPSDIYLGTYNDEENRDSRTPLPYSGERHLVLFGPNGCGKATRLLIPNLLSLQNRSIVVIDPKGELTAITADYRRTVGDVVVLNPFGVLDIPSAGFNPLAALNPDSPTFLDDAAGIGEALIRIEDKDPHWSESAQGLVVAYVMWEVQMAKREGRAPDLLNVRALLTEPTESEKGEDGKNRTIKGTRITATRMIAEGGFEIGSLISRFMRETDEVSGVQSTADRQTWWLLSSPMRANLAKNDIHFGDLKKRPITVYVILPAERMRTHSVWLRLVIVSALRALYKPGGLRTLFMLDEFAQLGHLPPIEDAFGLVRGYGVQLWPILQDLTQLKALYKDRWQTFMANAGVVQGFAPNDLETADWMSQRGADTTDVAAGYNVGDSQSTGKQNQSQGMNYQQIKKRVFMPQDLMELAKGTGLIFPAGTSKSVPFFGPDHWDTPRLRGRAKPNPYFNSRPS